MKINFIGNYSNGLNGEVADETHLTRSLEELGHEVIRVPRDVWKAFVDGYAPNDDWVLPEKADINIICKWGAFDKASYIMKLREVSGAKVIYWTWDYMGWPNPPQWHKVIAMASDRHLTNEGGVIDMMLNHGIRAQYFPFDVADEKIPVFDAEEQEYGVVFFGGYFHAGHRVDWIKRINQTIPVTIFSVDFEKWKAAGIEKAFPPVYGEEFNRRVAESKICLQFSVNDDCWGYWSNRVGKTLLAGGFLLAHYTPGMELFLHDGAAYFRTVYDAIEKIKFYLDRPIARKKIQEKGANIGRSHFTSGQRCSDLITVINNVL